MTSTFTYFWFLLIGIYLLALVLTVLYLRFLKQRFLFLIPTLFVMTSVSFLLIAIFQRNFNNFLYGQIASMFFGGALFSILLIMITRNLFTNEKK